MGNVEMGTGLEHAAGERADAVSDVTGACHGNPADFSVVGEHAHEDLNQWCQWHDAHM